jgi:glycosyltransferase involved in cell wall biosynthesis
MKKVKSILIVTSIHSDFDFRIWKQATSLAKLGLEVYLLAPWKIKDCCLIEGVNMHTFQRVTRRINRFWLIPLRILKKLPKILPNAQIIHFHDIDLLPLMSIISFFKPVVYDVHENYPNEMLVLRDYIPKIFRLPLYYIVRWVQWFLSKIIKNIVFVVPAQEKDFWGSNFRKLIIWNYASKNLSAFRLNDYNAREQIILNHGLQYLENGTLLMVEIMKRLIIRYPNVQLLMTDKFISKDFRDLVVKKIETNGLWQNIKLVPPVPYMELPTLLNKAAIGLSPLTRAERSILAMPNKFFEFMAFGIPVVTSDLPYQTQIISKKNCGLLGQPEKIDTFVRQISKLLDDKMFAKKLGLNGVKAFEEEYNWEAQNFKLLNYYSNILKSP